MDRREALGFIAAGATLAALPRVAVAASATLSRPIPASGEPLPVVGLGTWVTFDVSDAPARRARGEILRAFLESGGRLVDSSPMYGASEETIGAAMPPDASRLFAASKVWTVGALAGRRQMENSRALWRVKRFDLLQVHNFLDWETHLATLRQMKAEGRVRYIGVTTSHGRRHDLAVPHRGLAISKVEPRSGNRGREDNGRSVGDLAAVHVASVSALVTAEDGLAGGGRREAADEWAYRNGPAAA